MSKTRLSLEEIQRRINELEILPTTHWEHTSSGIVYKVIQLSYHVKFKATQVTYSPPRYWISGFYQRGF